MRTRGTTAMVKLAKSPPPVNCPTFPSSDCNCGTSSITSVRVCAPVNRVVGVSTRLRLQPLRPGQLKEHFLRARDRGRGVGGQAIVDADRHLVDQRQEDRVAGVDRPARINEPGSYLRAVAEADLLRVGSANRGRPACGASERDHAEHEKNRGGDRRRGEERTEVEWAMISRAVHDRDSRVTGSRRAFSAASAPPAVLLDSEKRQEADHRTHERSSDGRVQHLEHSAGVRHMQPQLAEELRAGRAGGSMKWLLSPLNSYVLPSPGDDAVKHHGVEHCAPVGDDLADPVVRDGPHDREIARVEARLHAHPVGDHVAGGPADPSVDSGYVLR